MRSEESGKIKTQISDDQKKPYVAPELVHLDVSSTQTGNPGVGGDGPFETAS
jgi:hypothetical protein